MEYSVYHEISNIFMSDTIFRFDNIWGVKKYPIKSEKAWRHINFFISFCSKHVLE